MAENSNTLEIIVRVVDEANQALSRIEKQLQSMQSTVKKTAKETGESVADQTGSWQGLFGILKSGIAGVIGVLYIFKQAATEAFAAAEEGAQALRIEATFRSIAAAANESADDIVEAMSRATKGTIDDTTLMKMSLSGLAGELKPTDIVNMMEAAQVAARLTGTSVENAYQRISMAVEMKMPRALRTLRIAGKEELGLLQEYANDGTVAFDLLGLIMEKTAQKKAAMGGGIFDKDALENLQQAKVAISEIEERLKKFYAPKVAWVSKETIAGFILIGDKIAEMAYKAYLTMTYLKPSNWGVSLVTIYKQWNDEMKRIDEERLKFRMETYKKYGIPLDPWANPEEIAMMKKVTEEANAEDAKRAASADARGKANAKAMAEEKARKDELAAATLKLKQVESAAQTGTYNDLDIANMRVAAQDRLIKAEQAELGAMQDVLKGMDKESDGREQQIKRIDAQKIKIEGLKATYNGQIAALEALYGKAKEGSPIWAKLQQSVQAYQEAIVAGYEKTGEISLDNALINKITLAQQRIDTLTAQLRFMTEKGEKGEDYQKIQKEIKTEEGNIAEMEMQRRAIAADINLIKDQEVAATLALADAEMSMSKGEIAVRRVALLKDELKNLEILRDRYTNREGFEKEFSEASAKVIAKQKEIVEANLVVEQQTGSMWEGMSRYIKEYVREEKQAFEQGYELAKNAAQAMEQAFSDFFFDLMTNNLKKLSDYVKSFLNAMSRAISNWAAQAVVQNIFNAGMAFMSGGSSTNWQYKIPGFAHTGGYLAPEYHEGGLVTGMRPLIPVYHEGGYVPRFHTGGLNDDEVSAVLQKGEYVVSKKGVDMLDKINKGQALGDVNVAINVENQTGQPVTAKQTGARFDGKQYIVSVVLENISNYGAIYHATKGR